MKSKTLIAVAVASTFGFSAGAFAGSKHEVMTPLSVNETGEVIVSQSKGFSSHYVSTPSIGSTSVEASGSTGFSSSESASLSMDESLALGDQGVYSDFYVVSFTPATIETWDLYVIDGDQLSMSDESLPSHELALVPSSSDEMVYDLVLMPIEYEVIAISSSDEFDGATGE